MVLRERERQLNELVASVSRKHIRALVKVLIGSPYMEIIREVLRNGHDLVMTTRAAERTERGLVWERRNASHAKVSMPGVPVPGLTERKAFRRD